MMTELLYQSDSYLREFEATVVEVVEDGVVLDRTAFYPQGGGQQSDQGVLRDESGREYVVSKVQRVKGKVVHRIKGTPPAEESKVTGVIDWDHRYKMMRTHTALHILCGVIWRDYGASVTGGNMEPLKARMDFELESMSSQFSEEVEAKINEEVAAARPVRIDILPRKEAFKIPDLIRTKINLLPESIQEVRVVEIEGLDLQADGGTHVANTSEVGRIRVTGHESKGRINKRLRIEIEE
jgi:misacylated tRNA(Ala) deacylase